jgi:hypothetical protein
MMDTPTHQLDTQGSSNWTWPDDDRTPVDITPYYISRYTKKGLSAWIGAARLVGDTGEEWERRRKAPIEYLIKVASDAIHERLYYILARTLNLPQQHVFWAVTPPHEDLVAVAIRFEKEAFFPRSIDTLAQTVKYRRKTYDVPNTADFWRHEVLHRYCGTGDIHQAMVKGNVLFGIDAADCMFHSPFVRDYWLRYLEHYRTDDPARFPIIRDMLNRIASHTELPDLIEQELLDAPGPVLKVPYLNTDLYSTDLRKMHNSLIDALERVQDI